MRDRYRSSRAFRLCPFESRSRIGAPLWKQKLHTFGLLGGSFRPADPYCVARTYMRLREDLTAGSSSQIQRMQKALHQMNIQLSHVLSDITGSSGLSIIEAIIAGQR